MSVSSVNFCCRPTAEQPGVLKEPLISKIAARHGKSAAQVLIRYCIDRDLTVIPKSVTKKRIEENFQVGFSSF